MNEAPNTNVDLYYKYLRKNSDVRRCVQETYNGIGANGFFFARGDDVIEDQKYNGYINYWRWFRVLKNKIVRDVLIWGNAYIVRLKNATGELVWLDTIDPRTIRVRADKFGEIMAYEQFVNGKVSQVYDPSDVVNCYDELDPDNEVFGLSIMEGIILEILADNESSLTNYHYFKNSAVPSMVLKVSDITSDEEMVNTMKAMKQNFSWWKNKHKIGVLRGIEWIEKIQDSISDMSFEIMRGFNTNRICSAFGVPKVILWYTDGVNYTNADMQFRKFIQQTIQPREKKIEWWINDALMLEDWARFQIVDTTFDIDKEKIDIIEAKMRNWLITPNEARVELWYEQYEGIEEADQPLITKGYDKLVDVWLSDFTIDGT